MPYPPERVPSDAADPSADDAGAPHASPPENLPQVQPPSAGFIVQLFVVPGLIVMAILGVWLLFGSLASDEEDWRGLVAELRTANEHRRWRAALGLSQLLKADQDRRDGQRVLSRSPEVAAALSELLDEQLRRRSNREDDLKQQAFLARTLGFLDVPQTVLPVLQRAMHPPHDREVRKNALAAVAVIAGRAAEAEDAGATSIDDLLRAPSLVEDLMAVSSEEDRLIRQLGAYTLGLVPSEESRARLAVLLTDSDSATRVNAAVGLARQRSTEGLDVFESVLSEAGSGPPAGRVERAAIEPEEASPEFEELVALRNTLRAVGDLASELTSSQRAELILLIQPVSSTHRHAEIRTDALKALHALENL